jgi:hypothetical protein
MQGPHVGVKFVVMQTSSEPPPPVPHVMPVPVEAVPVPVEVPVPEDELVVPPVAPLSPHPTAVATTTTAIEIQGVKSNFVEEFGLWFIGTSSGTSVRFIREE